MTEHVRAQLAAHGVAPPKGQKPPTAPRKPAAHPQVADDTREAGRSKIKEPAFAPTAGGPATYLVGPYALSIGGRLHQEQLPDRLRIVVTGPASEDLPAALVAALTQFIAKS